MEKKELKINILLCYLTTILGTFAGTLSIYFGVVNHYDLIIKLGFLLSLMSSVFGYWSALNLGYKAGKFKNKK